MINGEKYKTAAEMKDGFRNFCVISARKCYGCPCNVTPILCTALWLFLMQNHHMSRGGVRRASAMNAWYSEYLRTSVGGTCSGLFDWYLTNKERFVEESTND